MSGNVGGHENRRQLQQYFSGTREAHFYILSVDSNQIHNLAVSLFWLSPCQTNQRDVTDLGSGFDVSPKATLSRELVHAERLSARTLTARSVNVTCWRDFYLQISYCEQSIWFWYMWLVSKFNSLKFRKMLQK